jgi:hypothetical protein
MNTNKQLALNNMVLLETKFQTHRIPRFNYSFWIEDEEKDTFNVVLK